MKSTSALLLLLLSLAPEAWAARIAARSDSESQAAADRSARVAALTNQSLRSRYRLLELLRSGAEEGLADGDGWWPWSSKQERNVTAARARTVGKFPFSSGAEGPLAESRFSRPEGLGRGGFGDTWKAYDVQEHREVAVKLFYRGRRYVTKLDADESRFLRHQLRQSEEECRLVQRMMKVESEFKEGKEHICDCYASHIKDAVEDDDVAFLVLELCGTSLQSKLEAQWREPAPGFETDTRRWVKGVLEAVRFMSSLRTPMQHFDIKLDNVVVNDQGEAKLIDFGLSVPYYTVQETFFCPLAPPEHWCNNGKVAKYPKAKAWLYDVWTIGALHYNLVCRQRRSDSPFETEYFWQLFRQKAPDRCVEDMPHSPVAHETPPGSSVDWAVMRGCLSSVEERSAPGQLLDLLKLFPS